VSTSNLQPPTAKALSVDRLGAPWKLEVGSWEVSGYRVPPSTIAVTAADGEARGVALSGTNRGSTRISAHIRVSCSSSRRLARHGAAGDDAASAGLTR